jgi:probable HAF family extracellular repeat protein
MTGLALVALAMSPPGVARLAGAEILYTLKDLGPGGGNAVNDSGQVAGSANGHAFLSGPNGGPLQDLGTLPGGTGSSGFAVNASGQVAGSSEFPNGTSHAFLSGPNGGALQDLGTLGGPISQGFAVNDSGQVTGTATTDTASGPTHAFLSGPNGGALKDLGTLGGDVSVGNGVNASGQVTGGGNTASIGVLAFLSGPNGGALKDLGTLGGNPGDESNGNGVNASGQVTGGSHTATGALHAFRSGPDGGALQDLGSLGGDFSSGFAINDSGQVVGLSTYDASGAYHAFLYSGGQMLDLNNLIAPGSGFTLEVARGISDNGYIVGFGTAADGNQHAFLLIPVPEPAGLVLLGTGAVALLGYAARRRARTRAGRRG